MKRLFKQTKVIYNAHENTYEVYYKNFLRWKFDRAYKVGEYLDKERAKELAIERAKAMLSTVEVYRSKDEVRYFSTLI